MRAGFTSTILASREERGANPDIRSAEEESDEGRAVEPRELQREVHEDDSDNDDSDREVRCEDWDIDPSDNEESAESPESPLTNLKSHERQESNATAGAVLPVAEQFHNIALAARQDSTQDRQLRNYTESGIPVRAHPPANPKFPWKPHSRNKPTKKELGALLLEAAKKGYQFKVTTEVQGAISLIQPQKGFIYAYTGYGQNRYIKIGFTTNASVEYYLRTQTAKCGVQAKLLHKSERVSSPRKIESMIHEELYLKRYTYLDCACPINHREWFDIDEKTAKEVIDRWSKWMHENNPYEAKVEGNKAKWSLRPESEKSLTTVVEQAEDLAKRVKELAEQAATSLATVANEAAQTAYDIAASAQEHGLTAARDIVATTEVGIILGTEQLTDPFGISEEPEPIADGTSLLQHEAQSAQRDASVPLSITGNNIETAPSSPTTTSATSPFEKDSVFDNPAISVDTEQTEVTPIRPGPTPLQKKQSDKTPSSITRYIRKWLSGMISARRVAPPSASPSPTRSEHSLRSE